MLCEFIPGSRERLFAHPAKGAWVDSNLSLNPSSLLMIMDRSFFDAAEIPMSEQLVVLVGLQTRPPIQTQLPRAPAPIRDFALLQRGGKMESASKAFVVTSQHYKISDLF